MKTLLPLMLLCGCAGSLVDHAGIALSGPDGATPACLDSCKAPAGATAVCNGDVCDYQCRDGQLKAAGGCHAASEISAGTGHTCAVVAGQVRCWGANDKGQLGQSGNDSFVPVAPAVAGIVTHVAAGTAHTCAIVNGNVWCWGDNTSGQLGSGTQDAGTSTPQQVPNVSGAQLIAAGGSHTCAANASKTYCWGNDDLGQLGDGVVPPGAPRLQPVEIAGADGALALAAGASHTCAVIASGVLCWGANDKGQLGNGATGVPDSTPAPTQPVLSGVTFLGSGADHGCAVVGDALWCWGANASSQIDRSGPGAQSSPKSVLSNVRAVAAGAAHTCAITKDQTLRCWGLDDQGQLGAAGAGNNPVDVALATLQAAGAGYKHTCATANGETFCWGLNDRGQLGTDPTVTASTPAPTRVSGR